MSSQPTYTWSSIRIKNNCAVCNQLNCHYTLTAQFTVDHTFLAIQSPLCGDGQCTHDLRSIMSKRITSMYGDNVLIEFYIDDNNDDPFGV